MSGHFESRKSTQNQIYKKLSEKIGGHYEVEKFLVESTVTYHVFQLHPYEYIARDDDERKGTIYKPRRKDTLIVETGVIQWLLQHNLGEILSMRKVSSRDTPNTRQEAWIREIVAYFEECIN